MASLLRLILILETDTCPFWACVALMVVRKWCKILFLVASKLSRGPLYGNSLTNYVFSGVLNATRYVRLLRKITYHSRYCINYTANYYQIQLRSRLSRMDRSECSYGRLCSAQINWIVVILHYNILLASSYLCLRIFTKYLDPISWQSIATRGQEYPQKFNGTIVTWSC